MSDYNRIILVTGANAGIGYELVKQLAKAGKNTVYIGSRNEANAKEAQAKLKSEDNLDVKIVQIEVTDDKSVSAARDLIEKNEGRLDVLVNNAGYGGLDLNQRASEISPSLVKDIFAINFEGLVRVTTTFIPLLRKARPGYGVILNVSSMLGSNSQQLKIKDPLTSSAYNASKAAVNAYTIALSVEFEKENERGVIKVNSVHPGWIATRINGFHSTALPVEKGVEVLLPWALLGPDDKDKTGKFWGPEGEIPW